MVKEGALLHRSALSASGDLHQAGVMFGRWDPQTESQRAADGRFSGPSENAVAIRTAKPSKKETNERPRHDGAH